MHHEDFVHLHLHSEYSLLDGAIRHKDLLKRAEEFKMSAVAVTDHGNIFGAIDFYQQGFKSPVKPIIGCEVYVAPKTRFDKATGGKPQDDRSHHLVLLVKNAKGYKNLCKMVSASYIEGFYYKPRVDKELLENHHEGLIALSACLKGEVTSKLRSGRPEDAEKAVAFYKELFGDRYYLELQDNGAPGQKELNPALIKLAKKFDIKLVATNDCHYLDKSHAKAHDALLCIQTGKTVAMENRMRFPSQEYYFKSPAEMKKLFAEIPEAITNTREVADRCNLDLKLGDYHLPEYSVPSDTDPRQYLENLVEHNLKIRLAGVKKENESYSDDTEKVYRKRIAHELKIINEMNFSGYFLIVWDLIAQARKQNIPVGPGRGSAAGSLVAYCLKITDIDPIKYGLLFERFLNPERISLPDIDIDFCMERREEVIRYVTDKYAKENVSQIITFGTMKARGVIRDVGRVLDIGYSEVDKIAKMVPETLGITIDEAIKAEKELAQLEKSDVKVKELLEIARVLEGLARHASTHAAGVVISPSNLTDFLALYKTAKGDIVTQPCMGDIDELGLLKMDFLGLRTLTVIDWTEKQIRSVKKKDFSINTIPMDDKLTFKQLGEAKTLGIFQLESSGMRDILRKLKPEYFTDIIAIVALYRPGPIGSGMIDSFVKRKHGTEEIENILPQMNEILKETYGVIVYQEQVMKLANELAGFTMAQADTLRKAMGKKKPEVMAAQREHFMEGAKKLKINEKKASEVFTLMDKFGAYGFNKSHSTAYALISYQTAYLKAHYPREYMAALLTSEMDNTDKVVMYLNELREMKIALSPPDINRSGTRFSVKGDDIIFGLAAVKNVGLKAVEEIIRARDEGGDFISFVDFVKRVESKSLNRRMLESLIKCGAFDNIHKNRAALISSLENVLKEAALSRDEREVGQSNMFASMESDEEQANRLIGNLTEWSEHERLGYEKETLGFYITGHPLARHQKDIKRLATMQTSYLAEAAHRQEVRLCGVVSVMRTQMTKKKERMAYVTIEDLSGSIKCIVWPNVLADNLALLESNDPLFIKGKIDADENEVKIIIDEIHSLEKAKEKFTSVVHLKLNRLGMEESTLHQIKKIAMEHKGSSKLMLHFTFADKRRIRINVSDKYKVAANDSFISDIENLLGEKSTYCS